VNQALSLKADVAAVEDALKDKAPKAALTAGLNRKANKVCACSPIARWDMSTNALSVL
jgi:hypothetical protein